MQPYLLFADTPPQRTRKPSVLHTAAQRDAVLVRELQKKTEEDPNYWSLPDRNRRQLAHSLFQYPAMMVPEVQRRLIEVLCQVKPGTKTLYDPFVGSGTALVAGMRNGLACLGQDINPLAMLLARVKTEPFRHRTLATAVRRVLLLAKADKKQEVAVSFTNIDKWFRADVQLGLSCLRRAIMRESSPEVRRFLWVTLAETIRLTSNDRTSTYKLHARAKEGDEERKLFPVATFELLAVRGCEDLKSFHQTLADAKLVVRRHTYKGLATVALQNTQQAALTLPEEQSYDLLVTSPPYGDNITTVPYGQHSYLALNWIDMADIAPGIDQRLLQTTQEIDRRSLGGALERAELKKLVQELTLKSVTLGRTCDMLAFSKVGGALTRVASFYRDLDQCLGNILSVMKPEAYLCWTVANRRVADVEIPIDQILKEMMASRQVVYVTAIDRKIHHKRMPSRNKTADTMKKERIMIFRTL